MPTRHTHPSMSLIRSAILFGVLLPTALFAQRSTSAVVTPNENLVANGIPAVPASVVEETRRYTEYRSAFLADWHPTRRELLISTRFGNTAQIHRVAAPGGARYQLTFFDEPIATASYEP